MTTTTRFNRVKIMCVCVFFFFLLCFHAQKKYKDVERFYLPIDYFLVFFCCYSYLFCEFQTKLKLHMFFLYLFPQYFIFSLIYSLYTACKMVGIRFRLDCRQTKIYFICVIHSMLQCVLSDDMSIYLYICVYCIALLL